MNKTGNIKINSENIMPIIKKWLYSDKDIFLREIISNATDAITKFQKIVKLGDAKADERPYRININIDKEKKKLKIEDNGVGMTADEVEKYITQVAFSGAEDFVKKYENSNGDGIIGHFGLGFYSAYMVSKSVEIDSLSFIDNAEAVHWISDGNNDYEMSDSQRTLRGTEITLNINDDELEFLEEGRIRELLNKYCAYMPYEIYLNPKGDDSDKPVNNTNPLWNKDPKECTDEEYEKFYQEAFMDYEKPLFWIHLNVEYPFNLKGILYFPRQKNDLEVITGQVKLFCNQVYIADNIKEVIPEFLMLLKGVIDCPDIPLNVSRSFLQNDKEVQKISKHITKKVADKLLSLFSTDRAKFAECWEDIAPFIKFGCIKNEEFYEKIKDIILFKTLSGEYKTYKEFVGDKKKIYYVTDENQQSQYVNMFKENGLDAVILKHYIDPHFISFCEYKEQGVKFLRIDSELDETFKTDDKAENVNEIIDIIKKCLDNKDLTIKVQKLKNLTVPAIINLPEFSRRFKEMSNMMKDMDETIDKELTLIVNSDNEVVQSLVKLDEEKQKVAVKQIYDLAKLAYKPLSAVELDDFIKRSLDVLNNYIK